MPDRPLISVITPAFNAGACIERCLSSVAAQTYPNIEHIVLNDGSGDRTEALIKAFMPGHPHIRYFAFEKNRGLAAARAEALKLARGEYIVWLDSDDEAEPELVESLFGALCKYGVSVALCNYDNIGRDGRSKLRYDLDGDRLCTTQSLIRMLVRNTVTQALWANIAPLSFYSDVVFREGTLFEDADNVYRGYLRAEKAAVLAKPLMHRYNYSTSISSAWVLARRVEAQEIYIRRAQTLESIYPGMERIFYERSFGMLTTLRRYVLHASLREYRELKPRIKAITGACRKNGAKLLPANAGIVMRTEFYLMSSGEYLGFLLSGVLHLKPFRHDLPVLKFEGARVEA